jgi:FSR family fosmidomycin resistance protein-like MFS transporter
MTEHSKRYQYAQLLSITAAHFIVDMFVGMMPALLPALRTRFRIDLSQSTLLLGMLFLTCNFIQVLTGHLRSDKTRPLFLYIGVILACTICFFAIVPVASSTAIMMTILIAMVVVGGIGVGSVHPEGLRAIHTLDKIPSASVTAFFMSGGIAGFAIGCYIAPLLVERFGLKSLLWLALTAFVSLISMIVMRTRLAADEKIKTNFDSDQNQIRFLHVMLVAVPLCTATTIFVGLLPTRLEELGFSLSMGGFSIMAYNLGGAIGAFGWAWLASKRSNLYAANLASFLALPILIVYLLLIENDWAKYILFIGGFCGLGGFPLLVTVARHAVGGSLGLRMGFVVGGTWGIAAIIMMLLGPLAEAKSVSLVIILSITLYPISSVFGLYTSRKNK